MKVSVRVELGEGAVNVATGLPVLDHLVGELAPDRADAAVARGRARTPSTRRSRPPGARSARGSRRCSARRGAAGSGFAWLPADEALAGAVLEVTERPLVASNVDFSGQRVGGLGGDVVAASSRSSPTAPG